MKPFDLKKALAGEPVVTRDGKPVTELKHFAAVTGHTVFGILHGNVKSWTSEGSFSNSRSDPWDLFMVAGKKTVWLNITTPSTNEFSTKGIYFLHNSLEEAKEVARSNSHASGYYLAVAVPVEVEI